MKKITLFFVILFALSFSVIAQNIEKEIVGKWKMVDIKMLDAKTAKPLKLNAKETKEFNESKKLFLGDDRMVLEFKDGQMDMLPSQGEPKAYTIKGKTIKVGEESEVYINIVSKKLELSMGPAEAGKMAVGVFEKQK